jgi:hypothetical protein
MAFMYILKKNNKEKGAIAILMTLLIMGTILLIAMGLSLIFINEIKNSRMVAYSGPAFYAADAGAEYALFQIIKKSAPGQTDFLLGSSFFTYGATAKVTWTDRSVYSWGFYSGTRRKVEISW